MIIFFLISFLSSIIGGICGIGGGVIVKPVLDVLSVGSAATISFLSSSMVLAMSCYSVGKSFHDKSGAIDLKIGTSLALGAAIGGIIGNKLFKYVLSIAGSDGLVRAAQSLCLFVLVLGTLIYTLKKNRIKPLEISSKALCGLIGLLLGLLSSFLGIGGGPFNLVFLHFFLGLETKKAAENSLYIILFSQLANLLLTLFTNSVPIFSPITLVLMVAGGILGGIFGRKISKQLDNQMVDKLFICLLIVICGICIFNTVRGLQI